MPAQMEFFFSFECVENLHIFCLLSISTLKYIFSSNSLKGWLTFSTTCSLVEEILSVMGTTSEWLSFKMTDPIYCMCEKYR